MPLDRDDPIKEETERAQMVERVPVRRKRLGEQRFEPGEALAEEVAKGGQRRARYARLRIWPLFRHSLTRTMATVERRTVPITVPMMTE